MEENSNKKSWINQHLATIIVGFFTLITGLYTIYTTSNQSSKDKMTDYKIEQMKLNNDEMINANNRQIAVIYSELYDLRNKLDVDRVFIIQTHPEHRNLYLSVSFEVDKKGVSMIKDIFQNIPISEMPKFAKTLSTTNWLHFNDINNQLDDNRMKSLMWMAGTTDIVIIQLVNAQNNWIGSLVAENIHGKKIDDGAVIETMKTTANAIQFILPPIN